MTKQTPSYDREHMTDREKMELIIMAGIRSLNGQHLETYDDLFNEVNRMMGLVTIKSEDK